MTVETVIHRSKIILSCAGYIARAYYDNRCLRSAAALSYTTLLSIVPLMAVTFSVLSAFPFFESFAKDLQTFLFDNFVPATGTVVQQHIETFTEQTTKLTTLGITFLVLSALLMMNTIEGAINDIWHGHQNRPLIPKFMAYVAILIFGPLLISISVAITSYLTSLPWLTGANLIIDIKSEFLGYLPFLATTLAYTLLYTLVPNAHVPLKHALTGALIAALLFELSKKVFVFYIIHFPTYEIIYGTLATIPVFIVWVYLSWAIILLGAETCYCLANFDTKTGLYSQTREKQTKS